MNRRLQILARAVLLLFFLVWLSGCAVSNSEQLIGRQLALDVQQKRQFDQVFFNEIWIWNQTSWRYGVPSGAKRQKEFESMAAQGYLPAYVALKMFDFEKPSKSPDTAAFRLLRQAADAGDVSSSCALIPISAWNNIEGYPRKLDWARKYIEYGAKEGHFACQELLAVLYKKKIVIPPDEGAERRLLLMAAKAGYVRAFDMYRNSLEAMREDEINVERLDRYLCWRGASYLYTPWPSMNWDFYKAAASGAYPQLRLTAEERTEVGQLASKWQSRMKAAKGYMDIALECLILEEGVK